MSAIIIQRLILGLLLVVLSFYLGSAAVEGAKTPILLLSCIGLLLAMNWLGRRSWVIIFLAPLVAQYLPLGSLSKISPGFLAATAVFAYYVILSMMGYVRLKWKSLWFCDLLILIVFLAFLAQFIRFPVGVGGLGTINDQLGGNSYIACLFATIFYIAVSYMPIRTDQFMKLMKYLMFLSLGFTVFNLGSSVSSSDVQSISEGVTGSRFSMFCGIGFSTYSLLLCYNTPFNIIFSLWKAPLVLLAVAMVLFSGFRENLAFLAFNFITACIIHGQKLLLVILMSISFAGLYTLSETKLLQEFPYGIQRVVSSFPGIEVADGILETSDHSLQWRYEMWDAALDPRRGYIKDYVWGDGYGLDVKLWQVNNMLKARGVIKAGNNAVFMDYGVWHSGYIHLIHRMGYVGLGLIAFVMCFFALLALRVLSLYRSNPDFPVIMYTLVGVPGSVIVFFVSAGETEGFFSMYLKFALIKILYKAYYDGGTGLSDSTDAELGPYVPMMLREDRPPVQAS